MRIRIIALVLGLVFLGTPQGNAHSSLVSSTPAADSVVSEFPSEVLLTFNENLLEVGADNPNKVEVFNSMGDLLSSASVVEGPSIKVPVQITGNDQYEVRYRVVSADGHVIQGDYKFTVESEIATAVPISEPIVETKDSTAIENEVIALLVIGLIALVILLRRAGS